MGMDVVVAKLKVGDIEQMDKLDKHCSVLAQTWGHFTHTIIHHFIYDVLSSYMNELSQMQLWKQGVHINTYFCWNQVFSSGIGSHNGSSRKIIRGALNS